MEAESNIIRYMITGEEGEVIPQDATHVSVHKSVTVLREKALRNHPNIIELICHEGVIKIEEEAVAFCPRLKRAVMLGVETLSYGVFTYCEALEYIECPKLEVVGGNAFFYCKKLSDIDLTSARIVEECAFHYCFRLKSVKFSKRLESIEWRAFFSCSNLVNVTIPLKMDVFTQRGVFTGCEELKSIELVEREEIQDFIDALLLDEWGNRVTEDLHSIRRILANAPDRQGPIWGQNNELMTEGIISWIERVLDAIHVTKSWHRVELNGIARILQDSLPIDIVMNSVFPFLELPSYKFEDEDIIEDDDDNRSQLNLYEEIEIISRGNRNGISNNSNDGSSSCEEEEDDSGDESSNNVTSSNSVKYMDDEHDDDSEGAVDDGNDAARVVPTEGQADADEEKGSKRRKIGNDPR